MTIENAGHMPDGRPIERITLSGGGLTAHILTYGAIVQGIRLAPFDHSLVLGLPDATAYLTDGAYLGAVVGRVANRLAGGVITVDGHRHVLDRNEGAHTLHGGAGGTAQMLWHVVARGADHVTLGLTLPDGHMGFPGAVDLRTRYSVAAGGVLDIAFEARAHAPTLCNLAPHLYFNLDGQGDARGHVMSVAAAHFLPTDVENIPTGARRDVANTAWDFRTPRSLHEAGGSYDHNFCLSPARRPLSPALTLRGPQSGITLSLSTTEPGVQVYDGGGLSDAHSGIALEPQGWPDAPNHAEFPSISLMPGVALKQVTRLQFRGPSAAE